ncbi:unnamed protein product [Rhodiola kirilowii]
MGIEMISCLLVTRNVLSVMLVLACWLIDYDNASPGDPLGSGRT